MRKTIPASVLVFVLTLAVKVANGDFTFGQPVNLGPTVNSPQDDFGPEISANGLNLYVATERLGGQGYTDVWVSTQPAKNDEWGPLVPLEGPLNTSYAIWEVSLTADGLQVYFSDGPFSATLPGGDGNGDVWVATRSSISEAFGLAVILPSIVNSDHAAWADISPDGLELYITSHRSGSIGNCDIWVAKRASQDSPWGAPVNLGSAVNSGPPDQTPDISYDGLTLFWAKGEGPEGMDLWMARRQDRSQPFGVGVPLPEGVNTARGEFGPCLSPDGMVLYFSSNRPDGLGGFDIWQASVIPVVDFSGNGTVEINDLLQLIESWGQDDPSVDVGPTPLGDGAIDAADLEVLMSYWGQEVQDGTLVANWKFDETEGTIASNSAGDNDSTVIGIPTWQPAGGVAEGALEFKGATFVVADFVLNPNQGPFSVFAWVKGGAPGQVIISQQASADWLMLDPAAEALMTELHSGGRQSKALYSDAVVTDGQWHRVGFTWDGSNRRLYVDDILVAEDTDVALANCSGGMNIACGKLMTPATFFTGLIDDVRIYNRAVKP